MKITKKQVDEAYKKAFSDFLKYRNAENGTEAAEHMAEYHKSWGEYQRLNQDRFVQLADGV